MTSRASATAWSIGAELLRRNLRSRYRSSALGYLWLLLTPVAMAATWTFLRRVGNLPIRDVGVPYALYVVSGMFLWQAFGRMVSGPLQQLNASRHFLGKYRFPWEALLIAAWGEALFEFSICMGVLAVMLILSGVGAAAGALLALPIILGLLALGGLIGLLAAPVGLLYDDIPRAIGLGLALLFFLVPIVYPVPSSGAPLAVVLANPAAVMLVAARDLILRGHSALTGWALLHTLVAFALLPAGIAFLRMARPHLASRL